MAHIFFPQWQGAGAGLRLDRGAAALRDALAAHFPVLRFSEVPLDTAAPLATEQQIIGRAALLRQLRSAAALVDQLDPTRIALLGGDCGVELAAVPHLRRRYGPGFALVWVDAHADLNTPGSSPSKTFHGMPLRVLLGEGDPEFVGLAQPALAPDQVVLVGVRELDPAEQNYIAQHGLPIVDAGAVVAALRQRGSQHVYVHLDLDALDPAEFPHTAFPTPGGLPVAEAARLVRQLGEAFALVGLSITEYTSESGQGIETLAPLLELFAAAGEP